jgi:hypothetical protein
MQVVLGFLDFLEGTYLIRCEIDQMTLFLLP